MQILEVSLFKNFQLLIIPKNQEKITDAIAKFY